MKGTKMDRKYTLKEAAEEKGLSMLDLVAVINQGLVEYESNAKGILVDDDGLEKALGSPKRHQKRRFISNPDLTERVKNRLHTQSMELFDHILEDLDHLGFTLQDVRGNYNPLAGWGSSSENRLKVRYGKSNLAYLTATQFLNYDSETEKFSVNFTNPEVAKRWYGDQLVDCEE